MVFKKKMQEEYLGEEQKERLETIVDELSEIGCREARFEVGDKDSEFTVSELQAFCQLYDFGLVGIEDRGVCLPKNLKKGILYMTF